MLRIDDCWYKNVCSLDCTDCPRYIEMSHLMDSSGIPKNLQYPIKLFVNEKELDNYKALDKIKSNILEFVSKGKNLYLCSRYTGNGKTSWAIRLMSKFFDLIWSGNGLRTRGLFIPVQNLLIKLKDFNNPLPAQYLEDIRTCDLVIWDDLGSSTKLTEFEHNQLLMLIDARITANKSNIYTSNVTKKEQLDVQLGARLSSRIYNTSTKIELVGHDRRSVK